MEQKNHSLLIEQNIPLEINQWDEIVRSLIMCTDTVWLHSTVEISHKLEDPVSNHLHCVLHDMADNGLVKFYSLESDNEECRRLSSRIISREEHMELYGAIIENINNANRSYADGLPDPERTSRIVECRNELWKFGIAALLDADLSVSYKDRKNQDYLNREMERMCIKADLTTELFRLFHVPCMAGLNTEDILRIRKKSKKHRHIISELSDRVNNGGTLTAEQVVNDEYKEIVESMYELVQSAAGNMAIKKMLGNTFINVFGIFFAPMAAIACGLDYYSYLMNRRKYGFVVFMSSLASGNKK